VGEIRIEAVSPGEVLVVDLWSAKEEACVTQVREAEKVVEGLNGVRWYPVCIDKEGEEAKYLLKELSILQKHQISEVPHLMIIDKKGIVAFSGHPAELDLSSTLQALIEDRPVNFTLSTSLDGEPDLSGFSPLSDEELAALPAKQL
jgi:hypothetical protein